MIRGADVNRPGDNQCNRTRRRALWQKLARVAGLLILIVHQAGAGIVCLCRHEQPAPHAITQTAPQRATPAELPCHSEPADDDAVTPSDVPAVPAQEPSSSPTRYTAPCCRIHAQIEYQAASAPQSMPLPASAPPDLSLADLNFRSAPRPDREHHPKRARPLYLLQSCILI
jgi:hypothetical protein